MIYTELTSLIGPPTPVNCRRFRSTAIRIPEEGCVKRRFYLPSIRFLVTSFCTSSFFFSSRSPATIFTFPEQVHFLLHIILSGQVDLSINVSIILFLRTVLSKIVTVPTVSVIH